MRAALFLGIFASISAQAAALTPQDFAYGMPIMANEMAAAYRVQLPVDVYKVSTNDLGDVRVFNADGEAVPYAIRRMDAPVDTSPAQTLPFTIESGPAPGSPAAGSPAPSSPAAGSPAPGQYVIDARPLDREIAALQLSWPSSTEDFSGKIRVETSDDRATWHPLLAAPVANLHAGGQQLVEGRIVLPNIKTKFIRLSWAGSKPSFELSEVRAEPAAGEPRVNWSTVVVAGSAVAGQTGDYDFDLGARLPLERVNLVLPDANSVYLADFKSRPDGKAPWHFVTRAGVYRVATADGEQSNGPIPVPQGHDRYWRVHLSGESGATVALRLQGSWSPSEIEFLAHGKPPFMLAYGSSSIGGAATDLSVIPSGTLVSTATLAGRRALGGEARINALGALLDKRSMLWVVLMIAVVALALMAKRLARERWRRR